MAAALWEIERSLVASETALQAVVTSLLEQQAGQHPFTLAGVGGMLEGLSDRLAAQRKGRAELLKEMKSGFKETKRAGDHPAGDASWEFRTLQRVYLLHSITPFFCSHGSAI